MDLSKVPHIKQAEETSCGAAVLAMVYQYWGKPEEFESAIFERIKSERPGTDNGYYIRTLSMTEDAQRLGFSYFLGQAVLDSQETALQPIKELLSLSIPVIVCQRVDEGSIYGHFRVVTKIDGDKIFLNDPQNDSPTTLDPEKFMKLWERTTEDEVTGGQFLAIFPKESIKPDTKFLVQNFNSSVQSFQVSSLNFA